MDLRGDFAMPATVWEEEGSVKGNTCAHTYTNMHAHTYILHFSLIFVVAVTTVAVVE